MGITYCILVWVMEIHMNMYAIAATSLITISSIELGLESSDKTIL
jgi:hypothetical protein